MSTMPAARTNKPSVKPSVPAAPVSVIGSSTRIARPMSRETAKGSARVPAYVYTKRSRSSGREFWYGDFRRYRAVGGRLEPLAQYLHLGERIVTAADATRVYWRAVDQYEAAVAAHRALDMEPSGDPTASSDTVPALADASEREAHALPAAASMLTPGASEGEHARLGSAIDAHLEHRWRSVRRGRLRGSTVESQARCLTVVREWFGEQCLLRDITGDRLDAYIDARAALGRKNNSIRNELHALSRLFTLLLRRGAYPYANPVAAAEKPAPESRTDGYLQLDEVARLLDAAAEIDAETAQARAAMSMFHEARRLWRRGTPRSAEAQRLLDEAERLYPARTRVSDPSHRRFPHYEALLATFFYTGGRRGEVLGLEVEDIDWHRMLLGFRRNRLRRLKRDTAAREVPVVPDLERILRSYLKETGVRSGRLFVSARGGEGLGTLQTIFARCARRAGLTVSFSAHTCRHTFATAMLRTRAEDRPDAPLCSAFVVAKLLGHTDSKLVDRTYGGAVWRSPTLQVLTFDGPRRQPSTRLLDEASARPQGGDTSPAARNST